MKKILYTTLSAFAALSVSLSSCSEDVLDKVNTDMNHATDVEAKFMVPEIITNTAINVSGGDFNTYASIAVEHEGGVFNQLAGAEKRTSEWNVSSTFNNAWGSVYTSLRNAKIVMEKTADDAEGVDAGDQSIRGIAEVMYAYNAAILTDLFGDAPFSEALQGTGNLNPALDTQESIYKTVMSTIEAAITDLTAAGAKSGLGSYDYLYYGDNTKWLKLAYGLKARFLMHTIYRASDKNNVYEQIIEAVDNSFESADDQAAFNVYDSNNWNPQFDLQYSRDYWGFSQSLYDKMVARQDPRIDRIIFAPYSLNIPSDSEYLTDGTCPLVDNGVLSYGEIQWTYAYSAYSLAQTASTYLQSYHETQMLKAEALARLGREDEAKAAVLNATKSAFASVEEGVSAAINGDGGLFFAGPNVPLTDDDAEAYYNRVIAPLSGEALLKEIMVQKYLDMYNAGGESLETYNDIRRMMALGENFVELANPENANGKFPLRYGYGSDDTTTNPNVQSAFGNGQYVYTENVWWAGGSR